MYRTRRTILWIKVLLLAGSALPAQKPLVPFELDYPGQETWVIAMLDDLRGLLDKPLHDTTFTQLQSDYQSKGKQTKDDYPRASVLLHGCFAYALEQSERLEDSFEYWRRAVDLSRRLAANDPIKAFVNSAFAHYLYRHYIFDGAIQYAKAALPGLEAIFHHSGKIVQRGSVETIAWSFNALGKPDSAQHYHAILTQKLSDHRPTIALSYTWNDEGLLLHGAERYEEALLAFETSKGLLDTTRADHLLCYANTLESEAHTQIALGIREVGLNNLLECFKIRKRLDNCPQQLQALGYLMKYYQEFGMLDKAYAVFTTEGQCHQQMEINWRTYRFYDMAATLLAKMNQSERAEQYRSAYNAYIVSDPDQLNQSLERRQVYAFASLRNEEIDRQLMIEKLESDQLRQEVRLWYLGAGIFGLIALSIGLMVFQYLRRKRYLLQLERQEAAHRKKVADLEMVNLKHIVALQRHDLSRIAADYRIRTELKTKVVARLRRLSASEEQDLNRKLHLFINELDATLSEQEIIADLQDKVENLNSVFEERLKKLVPNISATELRLCGLVKIGMSNREIALSLNKSEATIRSYKYRIRKKAGWDKDSFEERIAAIN